MTPVYGKNYVTFLNTRVPFWKEPPRLVRKVTVFFKKESLYSRKKQAVLPEKTSCSPGKNKLFVGADKLFVGADKLLIQSKQTVRQSKQAACPEKTSCLLEKNKLLTRKKQIALPARQSAGLWSLAFDRLMPSLVLIESSFLVLMLNPLKPGFFARSTTSITPLALGSGHPQS